MSRRVQTFLKTLLIEEGLERTAKKTNMIKHNPKKYCP